TTRTNLVTRAFTASMSIQTVDKLSREWHEAVRIANLDGLEDRQFPAPWYQGGASGEYIITPIESLIDLFREGNAMHNCSSTYAHQILAGEVYFYSVTKGHKREATLMLTDKDGITSIGDIRAICNAQPTSAMKRAARKWLNENRRLNGNGNRPPKQTQPYSATYPMDPFDDDIPF